MALTAASRRGRSTSSSPAGATAWRGLTAAAALLTMPRTFAHAHYAHYDMPMTCLWLLAQIAFTRALESPRWVVPFGILCGLGGGHEVHRLVRPGRPGAVGCS